MSLSRIELRSPARFLALAGLLLHVLLLVPAGSLADGPCCGISELVAEISPSSLERYVRCLSGADTVFLGNDTLLIETRHAYTAGKRLATGYLLAEVAAIGYEPAVQAFPLTVMRPDLTGIAVSPTLDTVWVGSTGGDVYRALTSEGWGGFERCGAVEGRIFDLVTGPTGGLWAAGGLTGGGLGVLCLSRDGGTSWRTRRIGSTVFTLNALTFGDEQFGIAAGAYGTIIRTADGGATWFPISPDITNFYGNLYGTAAVAPLHFWVCGSGGFVSETKDLGGTWNSQFLTSNWLYAIDFADSLRGVIVGNGIAFVTADAGGSWREVEVESGSPAQPELRCVRMYDTLRVIAGGMGGALYLSENGGADWSAIAGCRGGEDVWQVEFAGRDVVWAAGREQVTRITLNVPGVPDCHTYNLSDTIWGENIIFSLPGREEPRRRVLLAAHYDSQSGNPDICAPGADDNASGVGGVLEAARVLADGWVAGTVEFALFDGEEVGLRGSRYYAAQLDSELIYEAVINMDMIGWNSRGAGRLEIAGREDAVDSTLAALIIDTAAGLGLGIDPHILTSRSPTSDHKSFWEFDTIPSVLVIEGEYYINPNYHSCSDVWDYLDYDFMAEIARAALGSAAVIAGYRAIPPDTVPTDRVVLHRNWPNPFNDNTLIAFSVPHSMPVELAVYDVTGRRVAVLIRATVGPELVRYVWDGRNGAGRKLASGVYFLCLHAGGHREVRKLVLLK